MALKKFNPVTPGMRQLVLVDRSALWKGKPFKKLSSGLVQSGGRNNTVVLPLGRGAVDIRSLIEKLTLSVVSFLALKLLSKE